MKKNSIKTAFTLAEMMVVMLILSIVMAAFAPVMTTRGKTDLSSPWRPSSNGSDIYYGLGLTQTAMIGQRNKPDDGSDPDNRLTINTANGTQSHILFKQGPRTVLGRMFLNSTSVMIGDTSTQGKNNAALGIGALRANTTGSENIGIGLDALRSNTTGSSNTAIGDSALLRTTTGTNNSAIGTGLISNTTGSKNTALGDDSLAGNTTGSENTAVGVDALGTSTTSGNTAVGYQAGRNLTNQSSYNTAIGYQSEAAGNYSISAGYRANAKGTNSVSIGSNSEAQFLSVAVGQGSKAIIGASATGSSAVGVAVGSNAQSLNVAGIAIGSEAKAQGSNSISMGQQAKADDDNSLAVGHQANSGFNSVAVGYGANAAGYNTTYLQLSSVAIGYNAKASNGGVAVGSQKNAFGISLPATTAADYGVAIGSGAKATVSSVAIGNNACSNVTGSNKICIGTNSGPDSGYSWATDNIERVFIGSKSSYNNGPAVLEVHNDSGTEYHRLRNEKHGGSYEFSKTGVVVNGNLFVKGAIFSSPPESVGGEPNPFTFQWGGGNSGYDNMVSAMWTNADDTMSYYKYGTWRTSAPYSDKRLKYVGKENLSGLDKIKQIKVFNYTFKADKKKFPQVGVIAQDLQKIFPNAVTKDEKGFLQIRMEDMFYALVNAVKEIAFRLDKNEQKIIQLEKENKELKLRLDKLESKLK